MTHYIINKPQGYLSQFVNNQQKRKNKKLLGELFDFAKGTMAIGRLDKNSEGLLLLTTDGQMSEKVRSKKVEKEYFVQVDGEINEKAIESLKTGVEIGIRDKKYTTKRCQARILNPAPNFPKAEKKIRDDKHGPTSWISITLREGKFRQIRKMTAAVGYPTLRLIRVRIGQIELDKMKPGEVIEVANFNL